MTLVRAVRQPAWMLRSVSYRPIALADGEGCLVVLGGTRWSISASAASGVVRGAAVSLSVEVSE